MAHFPRQQLVSFLGLLAPGDIGEDAEHRSLLNSGIAPLAAGGDPADIIPDQDAEIRLIGPEHGTRRGKRSANTIPIGGMDARRQFLEGD